MPILSILDNVLDGRRSRGVAEVNQQNQGNKLNEAVLRELLGDRAFDEPERSRTQQRRDVPTREQLRRPTAPAEPEPVDSNVALGEGRLLRGLLSAIFRD